MSPKETPSISVMAKRGVLGSHSSFSVHLCVPVYVCVCLCECAHARDPCSHVRLFLPSTRQVLGIEFRPSDFGSKCFSLLSRLTSLEFYSFTVFSLTVSKLPFIFNSQGGTLCFSKLDYAVAWFIRESMTIYIFLSALWDPTISWRTGRYRLRCGGTAEEILDVQRELRDCAQRMEQKYYKLCLQKCF